MPEWFENITLGQLVGWIVAATAIVVALVPAVRFIARIIQGTQKFLDDWNGVPPRKDRNGEVIEPGKPGIPAVLERVRKQVENDHTTNFREDLDEVSQSVRKVATKLDEHIVISKHHDRQQERTAKKLDDHVKQTETLLPMLSDLHKLWSNGKRSKPTT